MLEIHLCYYRYCILLNAGRNFGYGFSSVEVDEVFFHDTEPTRSAEAQEVYWRTRLGLKNKHIWVWPPERL